MYVFLGTMLGLIFAGIYILVNLACIGYFWRERRDEFNVIKHLLVPILGVIAMIPALLAVIGGLTIPILDIELPPYETALRYTAPIVGVWVVLGIVIYFVLRARSPEALGRVGDVYGGDGAAPIRRPFHRSGRPTDRCGPASGPARRLREDAQRAVGGDDEVRHVDDLADAQIDGHAAQQVGLHRVEPVLAAEPLDHALARRRAPPS